MREALRGQARVVDEQVIVVEVGVAVRGHGGGPVFLDHLVEHSHQVAGLHVLKSPWTAVEKQLQLATENFRAAPGLLQPHVVILRDRGDHHHNTSTIAAQLRQRAADSDLEIVGMRSDGDHRLSRIAGSKRLRLRAQVRGTVHLHGSTSLGCSSCQAGILYRYKVKSFGRYVWFTLAAGVRCSPTSNAFAGST